MHQNLEGLEKRCFLSISGLTVSQVREAYGFDQLSLDGSGQTIES
jgi:hypothetical protein